MCMLLGICFFCCFYSLVADEREGKCQHVIKEKTSKMT